MRISGAGSVGIWVHDTLDMVISGAGNVVLKDFGDTSSVPRALITGLQGMTCSRVMPTLEPMFEALMARLEEVKVPLLLHAGLPRFRF